MLKLWIFLFSTVYAADPLTVRENNAAVQLIEKDRSIEAQQKLQKSVVNHAMKGEFHYNLAQTYELNEDPDKALKEYQAAAGLAQDKELKFNALFNTARIHGEKKEVAQALQNYQAALEIKPDSIETKTNIELLMKQGGGNGGKGGGKDQSKGQGDQNKDQSEDQGKQDKENQNPNQGQKQYAQPKPRPFQSQDLSPQDVKKIFEEVQRQDDKIRGKILEKKPKERKVGKDW